MSQKTENQVAEMKKQTIGVEVEMNSITRSAAAKLAAEFFGTGRYEDTARRNGYCTWSAWDESGREWKFQKDVSIAGPDSEKCEMVTPILTYADMETLQELIRRLRRAGAKSDATRGCGVHIHIGAKGHTPQTLRNLANIMASHEDLLASALDLDRGRISRYCRTVDPRFLERLNRRKPTTMAELADIWYGSQNADYGRSQHYNDSRYRKSIDAGNDLIDFSDVIWDYDIEAIAQTFADSGITEFTISSRFSDLIPTLAAFDKLGFKMAGMTEVNAAYTDWQTGKHPRRPAIRLERR